MTTITASPAASVGSMTGEERFLAAARLQPVDATPVWFMRQAGRSFAAYRKLREQYDILTLAKTPDLCAEVTLMPVDALHVDGAVLFADIMLTVEGMGVGLTIEPEIGPIIHEPIRTLADVQRLRRIEPAESVPFLLEAIGMLRGELSQDGKAALIGFAGSPYTLACYLVEGRPSRDYALAKGLMLREPATWAALMEALTESIIVYLKAQVAAGVQVLQLFDSWVGGLSPLDYDRWVLPYVQRIFAALKADYPDVPTIYFGTSTASLLERMAAAGSDLVSVDWRVNLDEAWQRIGYDKGIQGNLDPVRPVAGWEPTWDGAQDVLRRAGGRAGHIFNLGHGVLPSTDPALLARLVEGVHAATAAAVQDGSRSA